jgi:uncharacterized protein (DUF169 family)
MEGQSFYTVPKDHFNCAVGAYVNRIGLPQDRAKELEETVAFMVANQYIEMAEVPGIPTLEATPACIAYAPAETASFTPTVVLVAARPAEAMLLYEAALRAGAGNALSNIMGRPGCAVLPLARQSGMAALSFGCKGNRTYTGLPDDELYLAIPGHAWTAVKEKLEEIERANAAVGQFHEGRKAQFHIV